MYNHNHVYPSYVLYSVVALTSEFLVDPGLGAIFLICFISVSEVFWCPLLPLSPSLQCSCILFDVSFLLTTGKFSSPAQVRLIAQTDEFVLHPFCWGHQLYCWSVQVLYWCPPLMDVLYACCCSAAPLFKTFFFISWQYCVVLQLIEKGVDQHFQLIALTSPFLCFWIGRQQCYLDIISW